MKKKRILALFLAAVSCLSLAVSVSAATTPNRKTTDFRDFDKSAWYAEAVSAAVDNGLLYGKSATVIDPNGDMTRTEMAAIINRSFGCYKAADISQYKDVAKSKWYYKDVALAVQMGTYNGRSSSAMAPDSPITRQEAMTVVARALELDYDSYSKTDLSVFSDRSEISNWALPYVRAMVGADYIHGRGKVLAPLDNITRAEFAQIFHNIIGTYIVSKGIYDKDIKGSVLIRTDDVKLKNLTVDGDLIIGCGAADGKITLDNVTVKGRLLVWGGGTKAVYCNNGTNMPEVVVARVDDAVKVIYDRDSTLAVIDMIKVRITERAKQHKETEVIFYDVSGLREAQKQLNAIVADNQIALTAPAHLYALVGEQSVKAEFVNNSKLIVRDNRVELLLGFAQSGNVVKNNFRFLVLLRTFGDTNLDRVNDRKGGISVINDFHGIVYAGYDDFRHLRSVIAVHSFRTAAPNEQTPFDGHIVERDFTVCRTAADDEIAVYGQVFQLYIVGADQDTAFNVLVVGSLGHNVSANDVMENLRKFCAGDIIQRFQPFGSAVDIIRADHCPDIGQCPVGNLVAVGEFGQIRLRIRIVVQL